MSSYLRTSDPISASSLLSPLANFGAFASVSLVALASLTLLAPAAQAQLTAQAAPSASVQGAHDAFGVNDPLATDDVVLWQPDWEALHTAALSGGPAIRTNANPTDPLYAGQDDKRPKLYIGTHAGTLGFGLHTGLFANSQASARLSGDFLHLALGLAGDDTDGLSSSGGSGTTGYTYNASALVDNLSVALSGNYHPGNGGFFVGAGAQLGAPRASLKANGKIWEGSNVVPYALSAKVQPSWPVGPYASLGYSAQLQASPGFSFFGELGAGYFGAVATSQSANLNCASFSTPEAQTDCNNIQSDFSNAVDNFSAQYIYPVMRLGFSYRF